MTRTTIQETLEKTGILVIDGSMSTALEQLGCDLNDSLWTAKALDRQPELVERVHENYFTAGADCGITCSYQATIPGLMAKGHTLAEAEGLITRSVELFLEGPAGPGRCAWGPLGPTGRIWRTGRNTGATTGSAMTSSGTSTAAGWSSFGRPGRTCC